MKCQPAQDRRLLLDGDPEQEYATRRCSRGENLYLKTADLVAAWHSPRKVCVIVVVVIEQAKAVHKKTRETH
jgi:hypothetical protein